MRHSTTRNYRQKWMSFGACYRGQIIYFAFNDPDNRYSNIFDGYRVIHELTLVAADKRGSDFSDWYAVEETNFEGAPQCWGRSVSSDQQL